MRQLEIANKRIAELERELARARELEGRGLEDREHCLAHIAANIEDVFWLVDASRGTDYRVLYVNAAFEAMCGYTPEALYRDTSLWTKCIHEEDREGAKTIFSSFLRGAGDCDQHLRIRRPDASIRVVNVRGQLVRDAAGAIERAVGIVRDITDHHASELALRESEEHLRTVFESTGDYLLLLDLEHRVRILNRTEPEFEREQIIGRPLYELVAPENRERIKRALDSVIRDGRQERYDSSYVTSKGKTVYLNAVVSPIVIDGKVAGSTVSSRDVSDRVLLEQERDRLERQYYQAQKMEAVGRLASGVAHDFNNALCAIVGNAHFALAQLPPDDPLCEIIAEINAASDYAASLTRQLLAFSRKQVIAPRVFNLGDLVDGMHALLARLIGEDIGLRCKILGDVGNVRVDRGQLEQVLFNLVVNARHAMPDGGMILISVENAIGGEDGKDYVVLRVQDAGSGMSEGVMSQIFEPFFTTKEVGHGTGLGLATVLGIVEQNGGRLEVESKEGEGSTFSVLLPRIHEKVDAPLIPDSAEDGTGDETVLVVEDEKRVRKTAARILRSWGYTALVAASGKEALRVATAYRGRIDLLLTDVVMPQMDGRELAKQLQAQRPEIKVLFTSGYASTIIAERGVIAEGLQFVEKPYTPYALGVGVRSILDSPGAPLD